MNRWMKQMLVVMALLLLPTIAAAQGPVLMVELPQEANMVENVMFENGDFIQSYQLPDGAQVQMLRFASFDMTLDELAEGEWTGYTEARSMELAQIGECPASGLELSYREGSGKQMTVYLILVDARSQSLLFTAVFPETIGKESVHAYMDAWLGNMTVAGIEEGEVG